MWARDKQKCWANAKETEIVGQTMGFWGRTFLRRFFTFSLLRVFLASTTTHTSSCSANNDEKYLTTHDVWSHFSLGKVFLKGLGWKKHWKKGDLTKKNVFISKTRQFFGIYVSKYTEGDCYERPTYERSMLYSVFQRFRKAKFAYGSLIFRSSQFLLLPKLPLKRRSL